jgi:single-strand DNA-binding protein
VDLNSINLIGRLTADPDVKTINNSTLATITIAINYGFGDKKESYFFRAESWGKTADVINQYCKKGNQIAIQGKLRQKKWDSQDGKKNSATYIAIDSLQLLGGKQTNSENYNPNIAPSENSSVAGNKQAYSYSETEVLPSEDIF